MSSFSLETRRRPLLLAQHLWRLRREVRSGCSADYWKAFVKSARSDTESEILCASKYHFGFGVRIRNQFLHHGLWAQRLSDAAGLWWTDADELSGMILVYLVWSVRRRSTDMESALEFVKSECWERL